jgi:hypothetical protein
MQNIIMALAPVFAAGFAIQQLLEVPGTLIELYGKDKAQQYKKIILGVLGAIIGCSLAAGVDDLAVLRVLLTHTVTDALGKTTTVVPVISRWVEVPVTGLILSAGTEGVNSILKFMKYTKEDKKNEASKSTPTDSTAKTPMTPLSMTAELKQINLK